MCIIAHKYSLTAKILSTIIYSYNITFFNFRGTDPIKFPVTFHCNNVDEDTASANVKLGELNYEEDASMTLRCDNEVIKV